MPRARLNPCVCCCCRLVEQCNALDEVWVPSQHHVDIFTRAGVEKDKIVVIPESLDTHFFDPDTVQPMLLPGQAAAHRAGRLPVEHGRARRWIEPRTLRGPSLRRRQKKFVFLSNFKFEERKNWKTLVWCDACLACLLACVDELLACRLLALACTTPVHTLAHPTPDEHVPARPPRPRRAAGRTATRLLLPTTCRSTSTPTFRAASTASPPSCRPSTPTSTPAWWGSRSTGAAWRRGGRGGGRAGARAEAGERGSGNAHRHGCGGAVQKAGAAARRSNATIPHIALVGRPLSTLEVLSLYKAANAFVLPTHGEGWCAAAP